MRIPSSPTFSVSKRTDSMVPLIRTVPLGSSYVLFELRNVVPTSALSSTCIAECPLTSSSCVPAGKTSREPSELICSVGSFTGAPNAIT
jgi:hypothetical protein